MLNPELKDLTIPVTDAEFDEVGRPALLLDRARPAHDTEIALTWYDIGEPLLIHTQPNQPPNPALRRLHRAGPGARRAADRATASRRAASLDARARGPALQHLRAGLLGELDGAALRERGLVKASSRP